MCRAAARELSVMGFRAVVVYPSDDISHCRDCGLCTDGQCSIDDAMGQIYEEFSEADLLVLATPIHFSGPSSLVKTVLDRFQPYWYCRDMPHPKAAMALMCAGSDNPRFDHAAGIFRAFSAMVGMKWLGQLEVSGTDRTMGEGCESEVAEFVRTAVAGAEALSIPAVPLPRASPRRRRTGRIPGRRRRGRPTRIR